MHHFKGFYSMFIEAAPEDVYQGRQRVDGVLCVNARGAGGGRAAGSVRSITGIKCRPSIVSRRHLGGKDAEWRRHGVGISGVHRDARSTATEWIDDGRITTPIDCAPPMTSKWLPLLTCAGGRPW